jgi:hypothetical protein
MDPQHCLEVTSLVKIFEFYLVTQSLFKVKEEPEDDWDQVAEAEIREANRYLHPNFFISN